MASLQTTFAALADPSRRAILSRLGLGETTVSALADLFPLSLPAVLKHVGCLQRAGLVGTRKAGRVRSCWLQATPLSEAAAWIARYRSFWEERFDALDRYLESEASTPKKEAKWRPANLRPRSRSGSRASSRHRESGSSELSRTRKQ